MFDQGSGFRRQLIIVAGFLGVWFILSGWLRLMWPDGTTDKPGIWIQAKGDDRIDKFGVKRKGVYYAIIEPNKPMKWHVGQNFRCGNQNPNMLLWETPGGPSTTRVDAAISRGPDGPYGNVRLPDAHRHCGWARYTFTSYERQTIRITHMVYDQRTAPAPGSAYSPNLCVQTPRGLNCMHPMPTIDGIKAEKAASNFKTLRSFLLGFGLLGFAVATMMGYFRVYAIFFPSQSAKRATERMRRGRSVNIDDLATAPGSDFARRKHNDDLRTLLDEATGRLNDLEKKERRMADTKSEDDKLLDDLEKALKDVEEIQRKIDAQGKDN